MPSSRKPYTSRFALSVLPFHSLLTKYLLLKTGEYFACKVINKKLMAGREHMVRSCITRAIPLSIPDQQVRNEIAVLKRVSAGHPNICRLVDHFETAHNLYLVFDLCTGGELFDRICSKGNYYERYVICALSVWPRLLTGYTDTRCS